MISNNTTQNAPPHTPAPIWKGYTSLTPLSVRARPCHLIFFDNSRNTSTAITDSVTTFHCQQTLECWLLSSTSTTRLNVYISTSISDSTSAYYVFCLQC